LEIPSDNRIHKHENENENVRNIGQSETPQRKYKRLKLGGGHVYNCSITDTSLQTENEKMIDPTSRQKRRPTETRQQLSDSNFGSNIWSQIPEWA
jgi:hypothetical protein